jgi:hypothetical protein
LPVLDNEEKLVGILSLSDLALRAEEAKGKYNPDLSYDDLAKTLKIISRHHFQEFIEKPKAIEVGEKA